MRPKLLLYDEPTSGHDQASAINATGEVVGSFSIGSGSHAFRYSDGVMHDIGTLGGSWAGADSINASGVIVGNSGTAHNENHGFVYSGGVMSDLNDVLDATGIGYVLELGAIGRIADSGEIVARASDKIVGEVHAVLLTPWPLLSGNVSLQNFGGAEGGLPASFTLAGPDGTVLDTWSSTLNDGSGFDRRLPAWLGTGTYQLRVKVGHWLAKRISFGPSQATSLIASLINGDVDGDNAVTVIDYIALSDAFDTVQGDANWNANADLDGDGAVTVFDYIILSDNFDMVGDV